MHKAQSTCAISSTKQHALGCVEKERKGKERKGKERKGKERQGKARQGKARQGKARQGKAKRPMPFHGHD